jgi:MFS family permease
MRIEAWLVSYGLLGLTQNGLLPILLPLATAGGSGAGLTYAAFSLPGLLAPILGTWADRTGRHRDLLIWGTLGAGVLLLPFDDAGHPLRIVLAAGAGLGAMAATTAGNVLAIQGSPETDWDNRVARLQRFLSAGQVIGLAAAGWLAQSRGSHSFVFAGIALIAAGGIAYFTAPPRTLRDPRDKPDARPMVGGDAGVSAAHRHGHHVGWQELGAYLKVSNRPLRRFLIIWLIAYPAMNGIATLFPVAMTHEFGMDPILPSCAYAIGVGMSLLLYNPVGMVTHRIGGGRMLMAGLGARLVLLALLVPLGLSDGSWHGWLILIAFGLIQFVWPLLSVAANSLSVRLAPTARGESVGLFNAATSLAASAGSAVAGVIFGAFGFSVLSGVVCVAVAVAVLLTMQWLPRAQPSVSVG